MAAHLLAKIRCLTNDSPFIRLPLWNFFVTQKHCVKNEENSLRGRGASNISRLEFSILIRTFESILWNLQFSRDVKFKSIPFSRGFDLELEEKNLFQGTVELFWFILYLRCRTKRWSLLWCSRKWYWYANEDRESREEMYRSCALLRNKSGNIRFGNTRDCKGSMTWQGLESWNISSKSVISFVHIVELW